MRRITVYKVIRQDMSPYRIHTDPSEAMRDQQYCEYVLGVPCWIIRE